MGKKKDNNDTNKSIKFIWTPQMDDYLIDALHTQHAQGNRIDVNFTTKAYEYIVIELCEKLGMNINKDKVKNCDELSGREWKALAASWYPIIHRMSG